MCIAVSRLEVLLVESYDFKFKLWILGSEKADDLDTIVLCGFRAIMFFVEIEWYFI